ncbi:MAG: serine--tRNA ligase, partial [Candidatus Omnitrophica bacterium]|nr:serine--tRNA ligase [Candidatus Omnitrophota bacterium]
MLDIKWIRDNPKAAEEALQSRIPGLELTELLSLDRQRRDAITLSESLRAEQNKVGKEIPQRKKAGESADELIARLSQIKKESQEAQDRLKEIEARFEEIALGLPNVPHESVLRSLNKEDNQVVKTFGEKPS